MIISWKDVVDRYPSVATKGGAELVSSAYIVPAEAYINSKLSSVFTVPFSSNNVTAKDLVIEEVYKRAGGLNVEATEKIDTSILARIDRLISGNDSMILDDGTAIYASSPLWSSSDAYVPTFDMLDTIELEIDPNLVDDKIDERE